MHDGRFYHIHAMIRMIVYVSGVNNSKNENYCACKWPGIYSLGRPNTKTQKRGRWKKKMSLHLDCLSSNT